MEDSLLSIRQLIADDSHALTFQTFGQYRTALLKAIDAGRASQPSGAAGGEVVRKSRDLDDADMGAVVTAIAALNSGEIGFHAFCDRIASLASPSSGGWMPIATVPEKGEFLVFMPEERMQIQTARWHPNVKVIGGNFAFDMSAPTHWMPLPDAPPSRPEILRRKP